MTCIAGIAHRGRVYMGGDSASVCGDVISLDLLPKVRRRGEFVIGSAGDARISDLVHFDFKPPSLPARGNLDRFMAVKFVGALKKCFDKWEYPRDTDANEMYEGNLLVGVRGCLYNIDGNFALARTVEGFDAIGSGAGVALGALHATEGLHPKERINKALSIAAHVCEGVRAPFCIEIL